MNRATSPTGWARNPDGTPGYTWNPLSGCKNHTPEGLCLDGLFPCYAYKLANGRLKPLYLANLNLAGIECKDHYAELEVEPEQMYDPFYPRFWEVRANELDIRNRCIHDIYETPKQRGVFVCDMGDLFGKGVPKMWTSDVLNRITLNDEYDRFYLLTKQPQNLIKFSPFPDNCWVGVTATTGLRFRMAINDLRCVTAKVKYLSLEPLLKWDSFEADSLDLWLRHINWLTIGACTGTLNEMQALYRRNHELSVKYSGGNKWTAQPPIEWVREIVEAADKAGVKVFLKDNLRPLLEDDPLNPLYWANVSDDERGNERADDELRQEMPEIK